MRLRTTAAAFAGALALVLPTAAQAMADGDGFNYTVVDKDGKEQAAQLRQFENDRCLQLQHASATAPAVAVANDTDAVALLFDNPGCEGEPRAVAGPGERHDDVNAVAVVFEADRKEAAEPGIAPDTSRPADEQDQAEAPADPAMEESADMVDASDRQEEEADVFATIFRAID
ncbi:hypothetical protein [Streptomyces sp. WAC06614]|uniref:hypothetical protein n=1 Tax=Streptomyces sp. WAC06614 TaxID=2487416 RepID=UPI000F7A0842|nr:hypothetical protein [Streptomyces sp. WAC06614]RSS84245.1 hypothetical protein EF918_01205 [Streptomyces sp. WAC06614]